MSPIPTTSNHPSAVSGEPSSAAVGVVWSAGRSFRAGISSVAPLLLGVFPFALIAGTTAVSKGLTTPEAIGFSMVIFAGASQLAALELIGNNAPLLVVLLTAWIVNIRFLIYSASLAPHFKEESGKWKGLLAYLLTDQAFLLSVQHFERHPESPAKRWYYLGAAIGLWTTWQIGSVLGIFLGAQTPPGLSLDFAIPLSFIAMFVPTLKDRSTLYSAVVASISVVGLSGLPLNLGFLAAVVLGLGAGLLSERIQP